MSTEELAMSVRQFQVTRKYLNGLVLRKKIISEVQMTAVLLNRKIRYIIM